MAGIRGPEAIDTEISFPVAPVDLIAYIDWTARVQSAVFATVILVEVIANREGRIAIR